MLYKHLRIHQIFGANTDVGKTILATALSRSTARIHKDDPRSVFYLKPFSHVARFSGPSRHKIHSTCLYQLNDPSIYTHDQFLTKIRNHIGHIARTCSSNSSLYIETAGGVHSPTLSGIPQVDAYRSLFLPTVLIGDSRLGGISSTISAFESLLLRGYIVDAILIFKDEYYRNWEYLSEYFARKDIALTAIRPAPPRLSDPEEDRYATELYYRITCGEDGASGDGEMMSVVQHLDQKHLERLETLESMPRRTLDAVWWPFVQHGIVGGEKGVTVIDSAYGDFFSTFNHKHRHEETIRTDGAALAQSLLVPQFDGSASWWTQSFGHGHPEIGEAAARAAGRYGHVVFPLATHEPALTLVEHLLHRGPGKGWASKVFLSDNGSTGMEIALKMAIRAAALRYPSIKKPVSKVELGVIGLKGSYHGDTIGAMDACEGGVYNSSVEWHRERGYWFEPPTVGIQHGVAVVSSPSSDWRGALDTSIDTDGVSLSDAGMRCEFPGSDGLSSVYDVEGRMGSSLARLYHLHISATLEDLVRKQGRAFGALVIEPILMGAGGMIFVDPLFQRVLVDVVRSRSDLWAEALNSAPPSGFDPTTPAPTYPPPHDDMWSGLPVIFDEVFSGLYRLGFLTPSQVLRTSPDLLVLAKILTGGLLPLSVTLSSQSIFGAFWGQKKVDAMLHGHSYTAHPVGCAVANKSFELMGELVNKGEEWREARARWGISQDIDVSSQPSSTPHATGVPQPHGVWSLWDPQFVKDVSHQPMVEDVMALGTVLAIRLNDNNAGYQAASSEAFLTLVRTQLEESQPSEEFPLGLHFRPLGNVAYLMSSLNTPGRVLRLLEGAVIVL
ncbi:hypothetical protein BS47DRAFT_1383341 [Hydnum rufescens UP504]|uniref:Onanonoxo-7-onima-8-eninoihtemlysoneda n=1 Tax=Hydnum rufescens UP504 TaxID=1448309 RepID=A0A9P6ATI5_9AGAM|nr:hypothetical protein BS47DRAFT_1383341 [Hydnum rufescens UP504]